jgi:23S rRNA (adenine2503-C2)-methyltransferase
MQKAYPIKSVLNEIRSFNFGLQRRVSFEYIMFKEINDSPRHVKELISILKEIHCRINLIRFHAIPDSTLKGSDEKTIEAFNNALNENGITTTIRQSRGQDILAACGMLSTKEIKQRDS